MRLKNFDLIATMLIAVTNLGWALIPNHSSIVGGIIVLPLVFFLPGYTLGEVFFYKKLSSASDCFILSLGLSLAIAILSGFILNILPIGLQAFSWAVCLGLVTTVFSLIAAYLRREIQVNNRLAPSRFRISIYECILFLLAISVVILSIEYSTFSVVQKQHSGFTQFWLLPSSPANSSCDVFIGVQNFEATSVTYRIVITMNGTQINSWPSLLLTPQKEWDQSVSVKSKATDSMYIEARLYRIDEPETVYRNVHLTLHGLRANTSVKIQKCVAVTS